MGRPGRGRGGLGSGFARFWLAETVSSFGTYVTLLALQTLVVLTLHGTARQVGWLNAASPPRPCNGPIGGSTVPTPSPRPAGRCWPGCW